MKKLFPYNLTAILILTVAISVYGSGNSGEPGGTTYSPSQASTYTVGDVSFNMHYAPSGTFSSDDNIMNRPKNIFPTTIAVANAYWIAETDVTYKLWSAVKIWAITTATNKYTFVTNSGCIGSDNTGSTEQPVTNINWREAMIWCNALTEYYNAQNATNYACVYYMADHNTPIRSVDTKLFSPTTLADGGEDNPYVNPNAKGFRLPTSNEWELAARYKDGTNWTPGNYASGATDYAWNNKTGRPNPNQTPTQAVAVYNTSGTAVVKSKAANALGLYDMNGNVWQWCFDWHPRYNGSARVLRGGNWSDVAFMVQLGVIYEGGPLCAGSDIGFRFVKTQ